MSLREQLAHVALVLLSFGMGFLAAQLAHADRNTCRGRTTLECLGTAGTRECGPLNPPANPAIPQPPTS